MLAQCSLYSCYYLRVSDLSSRQPVFNLIDEEVVSYRVKSHITKAFTNFAKYIIAFIFAKFKYFAKQIIYLESPDHVLQNDI